MRSATVAIVGRPNVGKSTLFNRFVGGRQAIVDDRPGVTRDRNFAATDWAGRRFWVVDTGGWSSVHDDPIHAGIRQQIAIALSEADVVVLVVDVKDGVHPADREVADLLRSQRGRVVVAANKADEPAGETGHYEFHSLGLGDPQPVSAATGRGSGDLLDRIVAILPSEPDPESDGPLIQVAVLGRPNVGKSSLVNRLLGHERTLVSPEAGTTRDAIDSPLRYHGEILNFIDTAGLRKRSKVEDEIEFYSTLRTERAVERADVCVVVVDATAGVHAQDLKIAHRVWDRGRGLLVVVTKWDLIEGKNPTTAARGEREVKDRVRFLRAVPFLYVSALTGQRTRKVLDTILAVASERNRRIPTAEVNRVLEGLVARQQPPQRSGREVKLYYGSQIGERPPTFALVANEPDAIPESYRRFLENGFREAWGFSGVPIRMKLRRRRKARR
jgi:GTP-binding protein